MKSPKIILCMFLTFISLRAKNQPIGIDLIIISNNSPINLYACIESLKRHVSNYDKIYVLHSAKNEAFKTAYQEMINDFMDVKYLRFSENDKEASFKSMLFNILIKKAQNKYVILTTDNIIAKNNINLNQCIATLENQNAYGFSLNLEQSSTQNSPQSKKIKNGLVRWHIKQMQSNLLNMVIYNRQKLLSLRKLFPDQLKDFESIWIKLVEEDAKIISFEKSKTVALTPIILKNKQNENETDKDFFDTKLLQIFNSGFKINLDSLKLRDIKTNHIEYEVTFIPKYKTENNLWQKLKDKTTKKDKHFVFVIASYNNKQWYKPNLDSVFSQKYKNFHVIYTDAKSPDGTGNLVEEYIKERKLEDKILLIKNTERRGALENIYNSIQMCHDDDIIILLDGDDWMAHDHVLDLLNKVYDDENIWLTYGQYKTFPKFYKPCCDQISQEVILNNSFRSAKWVTSHLRTFYAWLFKKIKQEDLKYENNFFSMAWDLAIMLPMLEMCGGRFAFIPDTLYVYNMDNPLNDHKINRELQITLYNYIKDSPKYKPL